MRLITYFIWNVGSHDGSKHDVSIYQDVDGSIATNCRDESVVWSRAEIKGLHLLRVGTFRQPILTKYGDNLRIDWGYFYLGVPVSDATSAFTAGNESYREAFINTGHFSQNDNLERPRMPQSRYPAAPELNLVLNLGAVDSTAVSRHVLPAHDDLYSVEYMHQRLLPYWRAGFSEFTALRRPQSVIIRLWKSGRRNTTPIWRATWRTKMGLSNLATFPN